MTRRSNRDQQTDPISMIIAIILVGIVLLWIYVIKPFIDLLSQLFNSITNWLVSNSLAILAGIVAVSIWIIIWRVLSNRTKRQFEEEQRAKGLTKFVDRFKHEKWGAPQEVDMWKIQDYEEEQKADGRVKFTDRNGNTTWLTPQEIKTMEREQFEQEQIAKGLVKFTDRFKNEKWGTPQQVEIWKKEDHDVEIKESSFYRVSESIEKFEPSRRYGNEFGYHTELQGWLKAHFPSAEVEIQTGASRPDIVIDDIAIEVKGPTDNRALDTLSAKCLKYMNHYPYFIIVLFEPCFSESHYAEIVNGIERYSPNIRVIRKEY